MYNEPQHEYGVRTTNSSKSEGRLKEDVSSIKKKKRKILRKILKNNIK